MQRLLQELRLCFFIVFLQACSAHTTPPDTIRVRWIRDPESLNPIFIPNDHANQAIGLLHQNLLRVNRQSQAYVPWLAESLPIIERQGPLTLITYQLRATATWDNGQPIVAQDVAFTLKVINCPGLPNEEVRPQYNFIKDVRFDSTNSRRFTLVCQGRAPEFAYVSGDYPILPEYALDPQRQLRSIPLAALTQSKPLPLAQYPDLAAFVQRYNAAKLDKNPSLLPGSGPYQLKRWRSGQALSFQRKSQWWADRLSDQLPQFAAKPKQIVFQIIPDNTTALLALRRGDVDIYPMVPAAEFNRLRASEAGQKSLNFYTADSYEMVMAGFNTSRAILNDSLTRQALSYLFNIPAIIQATQGGMAYPSVGLINPQEESIYNDSLPLIAYSPRQAKKLLQRAGWAQQAKGGWSRSVKAGRLQSLELSISYRAGDAAFETIALQLRAAAAKLGIPLRLSPTESTLLLGKLRTGDFDIYLRSLSSSPFAYDFTPLLHSRGIGVSNFTRFSSPASDNLIRDIVFEENPGRKTDLIRRFQVMLRQECPLVVLFFNRYRIAAAKNLSNLHISGLRPGYDVMTIESQSEPES